MCLMKKGFDEVQTAYQRRVRGVRSAHVLKSGGERMREVGGMG